MLKKKSYVTAISSGQDDVVETTTVTLLNQINANKFDKGVANFARIPLTKFTMTDNIETDLNDATINEEEPVPTVTFAPDAVTISGKF